ncbi:hypothetical protein K488DRAFT_71730 [Vararia minispora EC-137]|uniref:Uncharacterized protein n=1 Tax=Vararia minispora EC-137 TaxID=1314806 RepID=A0ACB8QH85_9AGAM|nr:hypothetical protein K488DRAFT_71730 [Vararia minispora EC-137]
MNQDYAQTSGAADSIRSILNQYPFGVGILRELLQNSDDAGATKQVFVLDRRQHKPSKVAPFANGPALVAFNDAPVTEDDWEGLRKMHASPKRSDITFWLIPWRKVSDTPEILSGRYLAVFDPLKVILGTEGVKMDFVSAQDDTLEHHLAAFASVRREGKGTWDPFKGTAIRLPLRRNSDLHEGLAPPVSLEALHTLLLDFIGNELPVTMLFLRNVATIVVKDIDTSGHVTKLAIARRELTESDYSVPILPFVRREKLLPQVSIAVPLSQSEETHKRLGRLFTTLPSLLAGDTVTGDAMYWQNVPTLLARTVYDYHLPVWPLLGGQWSPSHAVLEEEVIIISESGGGAHILALCSSGLRIKMCRVPSNVMEVLTDADVPTTTMCPKNLHQELLQQIPGLVQLSFGDDGRHFCKQLLEYLLKDGDVKNIVGLPLLPSTKSGYITVAEGDPCYAVFDEAEIKLFKKTGRSFVRSKDLPVTLQGAPFPEGYNVFTPSPQHVADLVALRIPGARRSEGGPTALPGDSTFKWTQKFWAWVVNLPTGRRTSICDKLMTFRLLPTSANVLAAPSSGLFLPTAAVSDEQLRSLLEAAGLSFLHASFQIEDLQTLGFLEMLDNVPRLLSRLAPCGSLISSQASTKQLDALCAMLIGLMEGRPQLDQEARAHLRMLPIFPILRTGPGTSDGSGRAPIPGNATILFVPRGTPRPVIIDTLFIAEDNESGIILARASVPDVKSKGKIDLLSLGLKAFATQSFAWQVRFITYILAQGQAIPMDIINGLGSLQFVPVAGESLARPVDVVYPSSRVARRLLTADDPRMPRRATKHQRTLIKSLFELDLLITSLNPKIIVECIRRIMVEPQSQRRLSLELMSMMDESHIGLSGLHMDALDEEWIACEGGVFCQPSECRDDNPSPGYTRTLFDASFRVTEIQISSPSLRSVLQWDARLPIKVLQAQLKGCIAASPYVKYPVKSLGAVIQELGRRRKELTEADMEAFLCTVQNKEWIPVANDRLAMTKHAIFDNLTDLAPFSPILVYGEGVHSFLEAMGCSKRFVKLSSAVYSCLTHPRPSPEAILDTITTRREMDGLDEVDKSVRLLELIPRPALKDDFISCLLIPTDDNTLLPHPLVYYNDLDSNSRFVSLPDDARCAHSSINHALATSLRLRHLSTLVTDEVVEYGERFATRIKNALRQYGRDQLSAEFLANAIDAGASTVDIIVDERDFSEASRRLMEPTLSECQLGGALMFYNDSIFSEEDWDGIKHVGEGSKQSRSGKIGRFGLGVLSAYHISERFLGQRGAARRAKLENMRRFWPDHLHPFLGIHGFAEGTIDYAGTIFRLPLRTASQASGSGLSSSWSSVSEIKRLVKRYEGRARLSSFFTPGVALAVENEILSSGTLFSFLPLPVSTSLPFHLHASFILAEDRRSIRWDDSSQEYAFNKFLISTKLPDVYFSLLHCWPMGDTFTLSDARFWPTEPKDNVSKVVASALLQTMHTETLLICEDSSGNRIAPSTATFVDFEVPLSVKAVLQVIAPNQIVVRPPALFQTKLPRVSSTYVRNVVEQLDERFQALYSDGKVTLEMIGGVLSYIDWPGRKVDGKATDSEGEAGGNPLLNLPLIPLANGDLKKFTATERIEDKIFVWKTGVDTAYMELFGRDRFVHPDLLVPLSLPTTFPDLNITLLDDSSFAWLVSQRIQPGQECILSDGDATWVTDLWAAFPSLHSFGSDHDVHDILKVLPLIPTVATSGSSAKRFISFEQCDQPSTMLKPQSASQDIIDALNTMGAAIIDRGQAPDALRTMKLDSLRHSLTNTIKFLATGSSSNINQRFSQLGQRRVQLVEWVKEQLDDAELRAERIREDARKLPLFPVRDAQRFVSADDVLMLPRGVDIADALPFLPSLNYVSASPLLEKLKVEPVSFVTLANHLAGSAANTVCPNANIPDFRRLLVSLLDHAQPKQLRSRLLVPNALGFFVSPGNLYSRIINIFTSSFEGRHPERFAHPDLADDADPRLQILGMHVEVDFEVFHVCAAAIDEARDDRRLESARVLFNFYSDVLARDPLASEEAFEELDDLAFIPRASERRRNVPEFDEYTVSLPDVLAPKQMIKHLRVLRTIAKDRPCDKVIVKDVKRTYKFLLDRLDELSPKHAKNLPDVFLNVDNPSQEWTWCRASELIFNAPSEDGAYKEARAFLLPFSKLVVALGGSEVDRVAKPDIARSKPEETLRAFRIAFDDMRKRSQAVDVRLIDKDGGLHSAHRVFLAACSPFFRDMFIGSGMTEADDEVSAAQPTQIPMRDYSGEALEGMLGYMYTGEMPCGEDASFVREELQDVFTLADYCQLDELKSIAEAHLVDCLSPSSYQKSEAQFSSFLHFAGKYRAVALQKKCEEWRKRNREIMRKVGSIDITPEGSSDVSEGEDEEDGEGGEDGEAAAGADSPVEDGDI